MTRVKRGMAHRRHIKPIMKKAKGYRGARSRHYKHVREAVMHAGNYAYVGRKKKKRDFRALWIARINAAVRSQGMNYSAFMASLKKAGIALNRKTLSELAIHHADEFSQLVNLAKEQVAA
jgi:large subunit ribosomal protein L20